MNFTKFVVKPTKILVTFGDSGVLWGAPNAGKCKMTHYYWSKTTLGHLFWHPKSTPKELKRHPKSPKTDEISMKFRWKSQNFWFKSPEIWWFLVILGCFGGPQMLENAKWHTITGRKPLWDTFFGPPKAPPRSQKNTPNHLKIDEDSMEFLWKSPKF